MTTSDFLRVLFRTLFWPYVIAKRVSEQLFRPKVFLSPTTDNYPAYLDEPLYIPDMSTDSLTMTPFPDEFAKRVGQIYGASGFTHGFQMLSPTAAPGPEIKPTPVKRQIDINLEGDRMIDLD